MKAAECGRAVGCGVVVGCVALALCVDAPLLSGASEDPSRAERLLSGLCVSASERGADGPVYVVVRNEGKQLARFWSPLESVQSAIREGLQPNCDAIEIVFTHSYRAVEPRHEARALAECHRGVRGLEVDFGDRIVRWSPTEMLARNLSFARALELSGEGEREIRTFEADQYLLRLRPHVELRAMQRGNTVVSLAEVDSARVVLSMRLMAQWLGRHLHEDGRLTYKYWPSRGEESPGNNVLRQSLGTLCLARAARQDSLSITDAHVARNLRYNLGRFYREETLPSGETLGYIENEGEVKLGAAAVAALAIHESPLRAELASQETNLRNFMLASRRLDGSFRTFYRPAGRTGCENFYPGEALLYLSTFAVEAADTTLLELCRRSIRYYRNWHLEQRNPAFVPWHTQASYVLWSETRDPFLASWIFEMNDWLLGVQQWEDAPYDDMRGRFYDPSRPFGPPHASSTAVYLEGLADAYALALDLGDETRAARYGLAIRRGVRSLLQLQFTDETDLFYVSKPDLARGGLRTTEYDNAIRVDNVQHALMALLKLQPFAPRLFSSDLAGSLTPPAPQYELVD